MKFIKGIKYLKNFTYIYIMIVSIYIMIGLIITITIDQTNEVSFDPIRIENSDRLVYIIIWPYLIYKYFNK